MSAASHIHVRQLEIGDFDFVRALAAQQPNFTVPPPYVLWLMIRIKDAVCIVAEHSTDGLLAYLLAVPIEGPNRALFVWQLAASTEGQRRNAILAILTAGRRIARKLQIAAIVFSTIPSSPALRLIRRYTRKVFSAVPEPTSTIPSLVCQHEKEYRLELTTSKRRSPKPRKN